MYRDPRLAERVLTGQPSHLWTAALTCSHHTVCVPVCVCLRTEQSFPWEWSAENRRGPHILSPGWLWTEFRGHQGALIHHVENSLTLSPSVYVHRVIKFFFWKGSSWVEPAVGPLRDLLNKVHDASFQLLVSLFIYSSIIYFYIMKYYATVLLKARCKKLLYISIGTLRHFMYLFTFILPLVLFWVLMMKMFLLLEW